MAPRFALPEVWHSHAVGERCPPIRGVARGSGHANGDHPSVKALLQLEVPDEAASSGALHEVLRVWDATGAAFGQTDHAPVESTRDDPRSVHAASAVAFTSTTTL